MVYGKLKGYSLIIFLFTAAVFLYLWGESEKTYRTNDISIKVVSGEGCLSVTLWWWRLGWIDVPHMDLLGQ